MICWKLKEINFDTMENHRAAALQETEELFTSREVLSKHLKQKTITPYLGWDNLVYPIIKVQMIDICEE